MQMSLFQMYGQEDSPAKTSRLREWGREQGLKGKSLDCFLNLLAYLKGDAPEFSSSRTFRVSSLATEEEISRSSFERWPASGMVWDGVCLTAGIWESPRSLDGTTVAGGL